MRINASRPLENACQTEIATATTAPEARHFAEQSRAPATRRAYLTDTRRFTTWCEVRGLTSVPTTAETLANYLSWLATEGFRVASIERNLVAVSVAHRRLGLDSPRQHTLVRDVMRGIRRELGVAPIRKRPILINDVKSLIAVAPPGLKGLRDRTLIALGFAGALRRSELAGLNVSDLRFEAAGLEIRVRRSKTDPEGVGAKIGIPRGEHPESCAVRLLQSWLREARVETGPVFRAINRHGRVAPARLSGKAIAVMIKTLASKIGIDPTTVGGHSLRAGLVTTAVRAGKSERLVMKHTRHTSVNVFRAYVRDTNLFDDNAAAGIGL